jgi:hypothetical protein
MANHLLTVPTNLVYSPPGLPPRRAVVQVDPTDDPQFEVRATRPGPSGRYWRVHVQVCRLQPAWGYLGTPVGHTRESLSLDRRVVICWRVREAGWTCPAVPVLKAELGWTLVPEWTAARCFADERTTRLAYGLARLQVVALVKRLRCPAVCRGVPDPGDRGDFTLDTGSLVWRDEGGVLNRGDLPGAW